MIALSERYAQRVHGGRMHLVSEFGADRVASTARCGIGADGRWRMSSNVSWANACRRCSRCRPRFVAVPA